MRQLSSWNVGLVAVALVTPVLAGCIGGAGEEAASQSAAGPADDVLHEVAELLSFEAVADDGVGLRGHVYLPDGEGPFATVLEYSPYWNTAYWHSEDSTTEDGERTTLRNWLGRFLDAGFAVALVNMRGTGESDGCMNWGGPRDWQDVATVIEALADEPWSNGNIGMYGLSYPGWTQYMAIAGAPPSLKAVIPASGVIDLYSLTVYNGAPAVSHPILTTLFTAGTAGTGFMLLNGQIGDTAPGHFACPRYAADLEGSLAPTWDGDRMPYYDERDLRPYIANTTVPMLVTNGMTNGEGHTYQYEGLWDLIPHDEKRFLLGQWPHAYPDSDHDAKRDDFAAMAVAWMDHYLRGGPKTVETGVVEYQYDDGQWATAESWPPAASAVRLLLSDGALVLDEAEVTGSEQAFTSHDWRPLPDQCAGDKAVFVSPPLAQDVRIAGNAHYNLTLTSTLPDGNLAVHLWHAPELFPCDLERHDESLSGNFGDHEIALGHTDLRHRGHLAQGEDFPVGTPGEIMLASEPFAALVPAGDRLVVTVGGGDWDLLPDVRKPVITVLTGTGGAGEIVIPVVEGELLFAGADDAGANHQEPLDRLGALS